MENQMTDHILENGRTFLAITGGCPGGWAKARDPITAIKDAASNSGSQATKNGVAVMVMYGPSETLNCGPLGGFTYHATPEERPTPIGLFFCKGRTIKPMKKGDMTKGDMNPDHPDHEEWMDQTSSDIERDVEYWIERESTAKRIRKERERSLTTNQ
jgi:hypothetical protein